MARVEPLNMSPPLRPASPARLGPLATPPQPASPLLGPGLPGPSRVGFRTPAASNFIPAPAHLNGQYGSNGSNYGSNKGAQPAGPAGPSRPRPRPKAVSSAAIKNFRTQGMYENSSNVLLAPFWYVFVSEELEQAYQANLLRRGAAKSSASVVRLETLFALLVGGYSTRFFGMSLPGLAIAGIAAVGYLLLALLAFKPRVWRGFLGSTRKFRAFMLFLSVAFLAGVWLLVAKAQCGDDECASPMASSLFFIVSAVFSLALHGLHPLLSLGDTNISAIFAIGFYLCLWFTSDLEADAAGFGLLLLLAGLAAVYRHNHLARQTERFNFVLFRRLKQENISVKLEMTQVRPWSKAIAEAGKPTGSWRIDPEEIEWGQCVGTGGYGEVFQCTWNGTTVAVKKIQGKIDDFLLEIGLLAELRHPNIVLFMGASMSSTNGALLVTEFMNGGSLDSLIHQRRERLSLVTRLQILDQAISGLAYLHSLKPPIVHGDVKLPNVLIDDRFNVKLSDFGLSKVFGDDEGQADGRCTLSHAAPEVLQSEGTSTATDIYSFGIVIWETFSCQRPFDELLEQSGPSAVMMMILNNELRPDWDGVDAPPGIVRLSKACWQTLRHSRPRTNEVKTQIGDALHDVRQASSAFVDGPSMSLLPAMDARSEAATVRSMAPTRQTSVYVEVFDAIHHWHESPSRTRRSLRTVVHPILEEALDDCGGYMSSQQPNQVYCMFDVPDNALMFACNVQDTMTDTKTWPADLQLAVRIAIFQGGSKDRNRGSVKADAITTFRDDSAIYPTGSRGTLGDFAAALASQADEMDTALTYVRPGEIVLAPKVLDALSKDHGVKNAIPVIENVAGPTWQVDHEDTNGCIITSMRSPRESGARLPVWQDQPFFLLDRSAFKTEASVIVSATAFKGRYHDIFVSVKRIGRAKNTLPGRLGLFEYASQMTKLSHPNLVTFMGLCPIGTRETWVISAWTEYSLEQYLKVEPINGDEKRAEAIARDIGSGLAYIHSMGHVHRAISVTNTFVDADKSKFLIGDIAIPSVRAAVASQTAFRAELSAPEILRGEVHGPAADVFLFALFLYRVVTGEQPFVGKGSTEAMMLLSKGVRPMIRPLVAEWPLIKMVEKAWSRDAADRPTMGTIVEQLGGRRDDDDELEDEFDDVRQGEVEAPGESEAQGEGGAQGENEAQGEGEAQGENEAQGEGEAQGESKPQGNSQGESKP